MLDELEPELDELAATEQELGQARLSELAAPDSKRMKLPSISANSASTSRLQASACIRTSVIKRRE